MWFDQHNKLIKKERKPTKKTQQHTKDPGEEVLDEVEQYLTHQPNLMREDRSQMNRK